jgi:hypothetical protein
MAPQRKRLKKGGAATDIKEEISQAMAFYIPTSTPITKTIIESETTILMVVEDTPGAPAIDEGLVAN